MFPYNFFVLSYDYLPQSVLPYFGSINTLVYYSTASATNLFSIILFYRFIITSDLFYLREPSETQKEIQLTAIF